MYFCRFYLDVIKFLLSFALGIEKFSDIMRVISITITFSDSYASRYRLSFISRRLINNAELKRLIYSEISELPNNKVDWSSVRISCDFHSVKVSDSFEKFLKRVVL